MHPQTQSRTSASSYESESSIGSRQSSSSQSVIQGDVPKAVRSLLTSTKELQEILKQWSLGQATETEVSDVYVRIGTDFNNTIQAFALHQINLSDIHSVPTELRAVLEQCLAEDPTPETLAIFMPDVRQVLFKLLRGLQSRQEVWKAKASNSRVGSMSSR